MCLMCSAKVWISLGSGEHLSGPDLKDFKVRVRYGCQGTLKHNSDIFVLDGVNIGGKQIRK